MGPISELLRGKWRCAPPTGIEEATSGSFESPACALSPRDVEASTCDTQDKTRVLEKEAIWPEILRMSPLCCRAPQGFTAPPDQARDGQNFAGGAGVNVSTNAKEAIEAEVFHSCIVRLQCPNTGLVFRSFSSVDCERKKSQSLKHKGGGFKLCGH